MNGWKEGEHYYFTPEGRTVLTEKFLLGRGYCCGSGCRHCPYDYINVPEPARSMKKNIRRNDMPSENRND
jgi:hypothetical protein